MSRLRRVASAITGADAFRSLARSATAPFAALGDLLAGFAPGRPRAGIHFASTDPAERFAERFGGLPRADIVEQISISNRSFWTFLAALVGWIVACAFADHAAVGGPMSPVILIAANWAFRCLVGFILAGLATQRALINWQFRHRRLGFSEFARGDDWLPHPASKK